MGIVFSFYVVYGDGGTIEGIVDGSAAGLRMRVCLLCTVQGRRLVEALDWMGKEEAGGWK